MRHTPNRSSLGLSLIAETATLNAMKGLFKTLETEQMLPGTPWVAEPPFRVRPGCLRAVTNESPIVISCEAWNNLRNIGST